jgi:glutathione S-transferase
MTLTLYYHPLSSYSWKALIALYETGAPFTPLLLDPSNPETRAKLEAFWPIGKFPLLHDDASGQVLPESSIIIEYLDQHYPGPAALIPKDPALALKTRLADRFFDLYLHNQMQKIVDDVIRPAGRKDPFGVEQARNRIAVALGMVNKKMEGRSWSVGETFTLADCAAAPALYYANRVAPFRQKFKTAALYLDRLMERPSFARALKEAEPYFALFPADAKP